jgi:TetR/AcrR family transcriptional repressor of nem operon
MRVSRDEMARHHDEIVAAASKMLRLRGIDRMSVSDLMQAVGLTHGGFYRHFESKEALVAEATAFTFKTILEMLEARGEKLGAKAALSSYVADYLSTRHVEAPDIGCPAAAYGADVARDAGPVGETFTTGLGKLLAWISEGLSCPPGIRRVRAAELFALMVGAVVTARAAGDARMAKEILSAARQRADKLIESKT